MTQTLDYTWITMPGGGMRTHCTPCNRVMGWALEMRPEYGKTVSKHTNKERFEHRITFNGKIVQVWKCGDCKRSVVK